MTAENISPYLSIWAAVVSTVLGGIKIWETWQGRLRLSATYSFSSQNGGENQVIIENTSAVPAMISYWELVWLSHRLGRRVFEYIQCWPDDTGYCNITIPARSTHTLHFEEQNYFRPREKIDGHPVKLYLRTYLAGRKSPVYLFVWKPD